MKLGRALVATALATVMTLPWSTATATATATATDPGAPTPPGGVALTWAPTYMSSTHQYSLTEAVALAKKFDIIAGMPVAFKDEVAAMRVANPQLTLLSYANGTFLDSTATAGVPEAEFAHDMYNRRIRSTAFGSYLMEPSNAKWRTRAIAHCRDRATSSGYDGCLVDMLTLGIFAKNYVTSLPRVPGGAQYTEAQWRDQLVRLAGQYRTDDPLHVHVGNSVSNAYRYWRAAVPSRPLVLSMPAAQMEDFLRGSSDSASRFPSAAEWLDAVKVMVDMESNGVAGLFTTKLWSSATEAQVAQWQKYSMASFLMAANGNSYFAFTRSRDKAGATGANLPYVMPKRIGMPTNSMSALGAGYVRNFTNGKAVVNPSSGSVTINLGGSYRQLDGRTVTSVTLPPNSGDVLVASGVTG